MGTVVCFTLCDGPASVVGADFRTVAAGLLGWTFSVYKDSHKSSVPEILLWGTSCENKLG